MDEIRIGVIGVSNRGGVYVRELHESVPGARVVAGMDVVDEYLDRFREIVGSDAFVTKDYQELVNRPEVDAVVIASPDHVHEEQGLAVLAAGKHLLLEKPMAITVEGCDRLLAAHKKTDVIFGLGLCMRYMPMFRTMKQIIDRGDIGEVKAYWCNHYVGKGGHFYFHDWHAVSKYSTGLLLQKGTHDIDLMHYLTGQYARRVVAFGSRDYYGGEEPDELICPECPKQATCPEAQLGERPSFSLCAFRKEVDVEDNHVVIIELENGLKAAYQECHFTPDYHRDHIAIGTKGRVHNDELSETVTLTMRHQYGMSDAVHKLHTPRGSHGGGDYHMVRDFVAAVRENRPMLTDPFAGRMSVAVGCAAHESIRAGGRIVEVSRPKL